MVQDATLRTLKVQLDKHSRQVLDLGIEFIVNEPEGTGPFETWYGPGTRYSMEVNFTREGEDTPLFSVTRPVTVVD